MPLFIHIHFVIIIQRLQLSVARLLRTSFDTGGLQSFNKCFLALGLEKAFDDTSSNVTSMIDFVICFRCFWLLPSVAFRTEDRKDGSFLRTRDKVDQLCIVREDDTKESL